ncbi:MAG: TonB-dependent receptor [Acidobacteria bacterium]|nr:TonB-dependent receptor [Acidobacteriota bacterium]
MAVLLICMLSVVGFHEVARAQTARGSIVGTVSDPSGAVIRDADVTVTELETKQIFKAHANSSGYYVVTSLLPGKYSVQAEKPGFQLQLVQPVEVNVATQVTVNLALPIAGTASKVNVVSEPALVDTTNAALGQVVRSKQIEELPLNGRNFLQLALLTAGALPVAPNSENGLVYKSTVNISGGRESSNQYSIDGVVNSAGTFQGMNMALSVDAVQEFNVQRNTFNAEYGYGTAQVNVATRSGTNKFHGTAYEFLRNDIFDARQYFDQGIPPLRQNQFGASIGGPIRKNRSFFFGNYEGFRSRRANTLIATLPTVQQLSGDFSGEAPIHDPLTGTPFADNIIPADRISPLSNRIIALLPAVTTGGTNNYITAPSAKNNMDQFTLRLDENWGLNNLFIRYSLLKTDLGLPSYAALSGSTVNDLAHNAGIEWNRSLTPTLLNTARFGFNRYFHKTIQDGAGGEDLLHFQNVVTNPIINGLPTIAVTGYSAFGGNITYPDLVGQNLFQYEDAMTWVKGGHTIKFGGGLRHTQYPHTTGLFDRGLFSFIGSATGNALADFLLGNPFLAIGAGHLPTAYLTIYQVDGYIQDDWKIHPRLTLNLGFRYERSSVPTDRYRGYLGVFDEANGVIVPGQNVKDAGLVHPDNKNFGPRVGFSWQPFRSDHTVVRAGYGVYYDVKTINELNFGLGVDLAWQQILDLNPLFGLPPSVQWDNLFPPSSSLATAGILTDDPLARTPYVQQYSTSVQQQLPGSFMMEVAYAGSAGRRLNGRVNVNQARLPAYSGEPIDDRRPYPGLGEITMSKNEGLSSYNALQVKLERRYSQNLYLLTAYTYAKSLDRGSSSGDAPQDRTHPELEYGLSDFDQRQRFVTSVLYQLPFGRGQRFGANWSGFYNVIAGGWQTNAIVTYGSGTPFSVAVASDQSLTGVGFQRANVVGTNNGNLPRDQRNPTRWFDTSAFVQAPVGTFGNSGRNIVIGPPTNNVDFSIFKDFRIREGQLLQFRTELFNAFNHPQFGLPVADPTAPTFGQILGAKPAREIQFALKYSF